MNLSWLDDFLALAESGNFSRAAEERHMTQPAFSRRIRALEEWLGTDLFDRRTQPARLTAAGEWFRPTAQELLARVARVPDEARAVAQAQATTLRFAATHALSFNFLSGWLRSLEPQVAVGPITLVSDVLARCEALLRAGEVQFVMGHAAAGSANDPLAVDHPFVCIGHDRLLPVCAPGTASPMPQLSYSAESGLGRIVRAVRGAAPERTVAQPVFTAHLASVLRTMALDGRGLAWLPHSLVADDLAAGRLVPAAPAQAPIELEIRLYRAPGPMDRGAEDFWQAVLGTAH